MATKVPKATKVPMATNVTMATKVPKATKVLMATKVPMATKVLVATKGPMVTKVPIKKICTKCNTRGLASYVIDVLWCQPIKLIQVVCTSEFHEY